MVIAVIIILAAVFLFVLIVQLRKSDQEDNATLKLPTRHEFKETPEESLNNFCDYCQTNSTLFNSLSNSARKDYISNFDQALEDMSYGKYGAALDYFEKLVGIAPPADHYKIALDIAESFSGLCQSKTPNAILSLYDQFGATKVMPFAEQHGMRNKITQGLLLALKTVQPETIREPDIKNMLNFLDTPHPLTQILIQEHNQDLAEVLNNMAQQYNNQWIRVGGGYSTVKLALEQKLTPGIKNNTTQSYPTSQEAVDCQTIYTKETVEYTHCADDLEIINYALKSTKKAQEQADDPSELELLKSSKEATQKTDQ